MSWREDIIKACPTIFFRDTYFECGDGWKNILIGLFHNLEELAKQMPPEDKEYGIYVIQVKEKYAGLRVYMTSASERMYELIDEAEAKSYKTCEECGKPGLLRGVRWLYTACEDCHEERIKNH